MLENYLKFVRATYEEPIWNGRGIALTTERDTEGVRHRHEDLQKEATVFAAHLAAFEQEYARSPALLKTLGRVFGFGASGKLERALFKVG